MSVPVLSRSLIGDRTAPAAPSRATTGTAKLWQSTRTLGWDRLIPGGTYPGPPMDQLASCTKPDHPDPQSQSLSRSYGSNLPTSLPTLFYRPEAVNLGDLLRIWVRAGATPPLPPQDFQGPTDHSWMPRELRHSSPEPKPILPCDRIPGPQRLMQKRQLFPELRWASPGHVVLPRRIRGSERFRGQVLEYEPDSLSAAAWNISIYRENRHTFDQGFP